MADEAITSSTPNVISIPWPNLRWSRWWHVIPNPLVFVCFTGVTIGTLASWHVTASWVGWVLGAGSALMVLHRLLWHAKLLVRDDGVVIKEGSPLWFYRTRIQFNELRSLTLIDYLNKPMSDALFTMNVHLRPSAIRAERFDNTSAVFCSSQPPAVARLVIDELSSACSEHTGREPVIVDQWDKNWLRGLDQRSDFVEIRESGATWDIIAHPPGSEPRLVGLLRSTIFSIILFLGFGGIWVAGLYGLAPPPADLFLVGWLVIGLMLFLSNIQVITSVHLWTMKHTETRIDIRNNVFTATMRGPLFASRVVSCDVADIHYTRPDAQFVAVPMENIPRQLRLELASGRNITLLRGHRDRDLVAVACAVQDACENEEGER